MGLPARLETQRCTATMIFVPPGPETERVDPRFKVMLTYTLYMATNVTAGMPSIDPRWRGGVDARSPSNSERSMVLDPSILTRSFTFDFPKKLSRVAVDWTMTLYQPIPDGLFLKTDYFMGGRECLPLGDKHSITLRIPQVISLGCQTCSGNKPKRYKFSNEF